MFKKVAWIWIFVGLILFFALYIHDLAYSLGIVAGFIGVVFTLLTYLGASCDLAVKLGLLINSVLLLLIVVKVYWYFKES